MNALQLTPVIGGVDRGAGEPTVIDVAPGAGKSYALRLREDSPLMATPFEPGDNLPALGDDGADIVALVHQCGDASREIWALVTIAGGLGLNAMAPPLPVAVLEPGMLLAIGDRAWFVSSLWHPTPREAPATLRDQPCPVCGGKLGLAPVVECSCGRWSHLENPAAPDDTDALNCFIAAGKCGGCGRRATLAAHIVPEVPERLAPLPTDGQFDEFTR